MNSQLTPEKLQEHVGHEVVIVTYGTTDNAHNVALECVDCNEVLADGDVNGN